MPGRLERIAMCQEQPCSSQAHHNQSSCASSLVRFPGLPALLIFSGVSGVGPFEKSPGRQDLAMSFP